jgi:hypothetical protein
VTITQGSGDTTGINAAATAVWDGTQMLLTITNAGSLYTEAPTITIAAPSSGITATAIAKISAKYADADRTIQWTVPTGAPDWLWYGVNAVIYQVFTGGRIMVRDL